MLRALASSEDGRWTSVADLTTLSELLATGRHDVWAELDVFGVSEDDIALVADELSLHHLAVEDAMNPRQRPKLESYDNHVFAVLHQLDTVDGQLEARQLACFFGERYVLVVHAGATRALDEVRRRLTSGVAQHFGVGGPLGGGAPQLVHTLLDTVVDEHQRIADELEEEVERIEELLLSMPRAPVETPLYGLKQRLARFRRFALPVGEIVVGLERTPSLATRAEYFRDVTDHTQRIAQQIRSADDLANAALDLHRMQQANALNEVTKRLTGWAAIVAVPTFIASVYGMNFNLIPEDGSTAGFVFALALMLVSAVGLYAFFKRREWL